MALRGYIVSTCESQTMLTGRMASLTVILIIALGMESAADAQDRSAKPEQAFRDCPECPEMVIVHKGNVLMGSSPEETARTLEAVVPSNEVNLARESAEFELPQHLVSVGRSFAFGKYTVTRREFAIFVRDTGYSVGAG
jgi:formylglycine-generating enzyme required for sulfatase activity